MSPSTPTTAPKTVRVRLPDTSHLLRVGRYRRGEIVSVSPEEAEHLINVKAFERVPDATIPRPLKIEEPTP